MSSAVCALAASAHCRKEVMFGGNHFTPVCVCGMKGKRALCDEVLGAA